MIDSLYWWMIEIVFGKYSTPFYVNRRITDDAVVTNDTWKYLHKWNKVLNVKKQYLYHL